MTTLDADRVGRLRILESFRAHGTETNPYLLQLADALQEKADVSTFSWPTFLLGRYEVFHVHWPEVLVRGRTPSRAAARRMLLRLGLLGLRLRRAPIVRTQHNLVSHEGVSARERSVLDAIDRQTVATIRLTEETPPSAPLSAVVPHGHYIDWFVRHAPVAATPGRVLFFGLIRPYKGLEELVDVFRRMEDESATLRVIGKCTDAALRDSIVRSAGEDPRIMPEFRFAPEDRLAAEIGAATLVALPYRRMHNSGAALLALSLGRPVLVPSTPTTEALASEVGPGWVQTFSGELRPEVLNEALRRAEAMRSAEPPRLAGRDWKSAADSHLALFAQAIRIAKN